MLRPSARSFRGMPTDNIEIRGLSQPSGDLTKKGRILKIMPQFCCFKLLFGIETVFCRLLVKTDGKGKHGLISKELA